MADDTFSKTVKFNLGWGAPLVITAAILSYLYVVRLDWRDELAFIALVIGGAAAIYSAFYVGAGTRIQAEYQKQQLDLQEKQLELQVMRNTFSLIRGYDDPELLRLREVMHAAIDHRRATPEEIINQINDNGELRQAVRGLLNSLEDTAVAMRKGYADERLVVATMKTAWCTSAQKYSGFIEEERNRLNSDTVYQELCRFASSWNSGSFRTVDGRIPDDLVG